jgi:hypothetical protein
MTSLRLQLRFVLAATMALGIGACGAEFYARLAAPFYAGAAALLANNSQWQVTGVDVASEAAHPGIFVRFHGAISGPTKVSRPAATLITRIQVGAAIEAPLVFWALLLAWQTTQRAQRA